MAAFGSSVGANAFLSSPFLGKLRVLFQESGSLHSALHVCQCYDILYMGPYLTHSL